MKKISVLFLILTLLFAGMPPVGAEQMIRSSQLAGHQGSLTAYELDSVSFQKYLDQQLDPAMEFLQKLFILEDRFGVIKEGSFYSNEENVITRFIKDLLLDLSLEGVTFIDEALVLHYLIKSESNIYQKEAEFITKLLEQEEINDKSFELADKYLKSNIEGSFWTSFDKFLAELYLKLIKKRMDQKKPLNQEHFYNLFKSRYFEFEQVQELLDQMYVYHLQSSPNGFNLHQLFQASKKGEFSDLYRLKRMMGYIYLKQLADDPQMITWLNAYFPYQLEPLSDLYDHRNELVRIHFDIQKKAFEILGQNLRISSREELLQLIETIERKWGGFMVLNDPIYELILFLERERFDETGQEGLQVYWELLKSNGWDAAYHLLLELFVPVDVKKIQEGKVVDRKNYQNYAKQKQTKESALLLEVPLLLAEMEKEKNPDLESYFKAYRNSTGTSYYRRFQDAFQKLFTKGFEVEHAFDKQILLDEISKFKTPSIKASYYDLLYILILTEYVETGRLEYQPLLQGLDNQEITVQLAAARGLWQLFRKVGLGGNSFDFDWVWNYLRETDSKDLQVLLKRVAFFGAYRIAKQKGAEALPDMASLFQDPFWIEKGYFDYYDAELKGFENELKAMMEEAGVWDSVEAHRSDFFEDENVLNVDTLFYYRESLKREIDKGIDVDLSAMKNSLIVKKGSIQRANLASVYQEIIEYKQEKLDRDIQLEDISPLLESVTPSVIDAGLELLELYYQEHPDQVDWSELASYLDHDDIDVMRTSSNILARLLKQSFESQQIVPLDWLWRFIEKETFPQDLEIYKLKYVMPTLLTLFLTANQHSIQEKWKKLNKRISLWMQILKSPGIDFEHKFLFKELAEKKDIDFIEILSDYNETWNTFREQNEALESDRRIDEEYFQDKILPLSLALEILAPGFMKFSLGLMKSSQHPSTFVRFLEQKKALLEREDVFYELKSFFYRVRNQETPSRKKKKINPADYSKFLNLISKMVLIEKEKEVAEFLRSIDISLKPKKKYEKLVRFYLQFLGETFELSDLKPTQAAYEKIYFPFLPKLIRGFNSIQGSYSTDKWTVYFQLLVKAIFEDSFWNLTLNQNQRSYEGRVVAEHNQKILALVQEKGLSSEHWLGRHQSNRLASRNVLFHQKTSEDSYDPVVDAVTLENFILQTFQLFPENNTMIKERKSLEQYLAELKIEVIYEEGTAKRLELKRGVKKDMVSLLTQADFLMKLEKNVQSLEQQSVGDDKLIRFHEVVNHFYEHIHTLQTRLGQKEYQEALSFDRKYFEIRPILRNPGKDIFLGDFVDCCIGIGSNEYPQAIVYRLIDLGHHIIEVVDKGTGLPAALLWLYLADDGSLVIQNMEIGAKYQNYGSNSELMNFLGEQMITYAIEFTRYIQSPRLYLGKPWHGKYHNSQFVKNRYEEKLEDIYLPKLGGSINNYDYYLDSADVGKAYLVFENDYTYMPKSEKLSNKSLQSRNPILSAA